jgi:hypothetical protein
MRCAPLRAGLLSPQLTRCRCTALPPTCDTAQLEYTSVCALDDHTMRCAPLRAGLLSPQLNRCRCTALPPACDALAAAAHGSQTDAPGSHSRHLAGTASAGSRGEQASPGGPLRQVPRGSAVKLWDENLTLAEAQVRGGVQLRCGW